MKHNIPFKRHTLLDIPWTLLLCHLLCTLQIHQISASFVISSSSQFMDNILFLFFLGLVSSGIANSKANEDMISFNVVDFGAVDDGETDSSQPFLEAWMTACSVSDRTSQVIVPEEMTFLVNPLTFSGPCKAKIINFVISGTIVAPPSPRTWDEHDASEWIVFNAVSRLRVDGLGAIDGRGEGWWNQSCKYHPELKGCTKVAPTAFKFLSCNDSSLRNVYFTNSPQTHVLIQRCNGFEISNVIIQSPGDSPNTDGIHIQASHNSAITNAKISSGDDCVSIGDYVSNLEIANVECGPGHGISIGSLGRQGNFVRVENIRVSNSLLNRTTNGARIKTWQVGRGYVRGVTFESIRFIAVQNPIIIDQNYCAVRGRCKEEGTGVQISDIVYREMSGTSSTDIAINLNCSLSVPCSGIIMETVKLRSTKEGKQITADCSHAYGLEDGLVPGPCLIDSAGHSKIAIPPS